jgi:hypothetical protein
VTRRNGNLRARRVYGNHIRARDERVTEPNANVRTEPFASDDGTLASGERSVRRVYVPHRMSWADAERAVVLLARRRGIDEDDPAGTRVIGTRAEA